MRLEVITPMAVCVDRRCAGSWPRRRTGISACCRACRFRDRTGPGHPVYETEDGDRALRRGEFRHPGEMRRRRPRRGARRDRGRRSGWLRARVEADFRQQRRGRTRCPRGAGPARGRHDPPLPRTGGVEHDRGRRRGDDRSRARRRGWRRRASGARAHGTASACSAWWAGRSRFPILGGVALGLWLDRRWPGEVSWTLTLLLAGARSAR
jgi:ATP synthase protein I